MLHFQLSPCGIFSPYVQNGNLASHCLSTSLEEHHLAHILMCSHFKSWREIHIYQDLWVLCVAGGGVQLKPWIGEKYPPFLSTWTACVWEMNGWLLAMDHRVAKKMASHELHRQAAHGRWWPSLSNRKNKSFYEAEELLHQESLVHCYSNTDAAFSRTLTQMSCKKWKHQRERPQMRNRAYSFHATSPMFDPLQL